MPRSGLGSATFHQEAAFRDASARARRRQRLLSVVAEGFPWPQGRIFELMCLLKEPAVDLRGVSEILAREARLHAQMFGILHASPWSDYRRLRLPEAVVLLGSERLRTLVLGCALANFASQHLSALNLRAFWEHSLCMARISARIAREVQPDAVERAYFGGLLHDMGRLALLAVLQEETSDREIPRVGHDQVEWERGYFGVDHCEVGRWLALCGGFASWIVDVVEHHHNPSKACEEPSLVAIVAAGERCCRPHDPGEPQVLPGPFEGDGCETRRILSLRPASLAAKDRAAHSWFLESVRAQGTSIRFGFS